MAGPFGQFIGAPDSSVMHGDARQAYWQALAASQAVPSPYNYPQQPQYPAGNGFQFADYQGNSAAPIDQMSRGAVAPQEFFRRLMTEVNQPGLTGLDPKFLLDPRFGTNPPQLTMRNRENPGTPLVLMGANDDYDSAPIAAHSRLAADQPDSDMARDLKGQNEGPSDWWGQNAKQVTGGSQNVNQAMEDEMRRRLFSTFWRIEDRY